MSKPKILIFAPREEPPETVNALEGMGCELVFGDRAWQLPRTTHEDAVMEAARDAVALMGTSMRHTPISRRIMQASQRLRIVAKYTVGVDDIDTDAATDLGVMVCHAPTESNCFAVAETTVTFMLALSKKIPKRDGAGQGRGREGGGHGHGDRPHPGGGDRRLRGGAVARGFSPANARRQGAAVAPFGGLYRGRRASPGRCLGHPLGSHRARRQDTGQCVQQRRHPALERALRRGEHIPLNDLTDPEHFQEKWNPGFRPKIRQCNKARTIAAPPAWA